MWCFQTSNCMILTDKLILKHSLPCLLPVLSRTHQNKLYLEYWNKKNENDNERQFISSCQDQKSYLPRMAWEQIKAHIIILLMVSVALRHLTSQQCGTDLHSVYQMMLQGHTFKTLKTQPGTLECRQACLADIRCQSYNVVFKGICELNNRTKEARPDDFVKDLERYYVKSSTRGKKTN